MTSLAFILGVLPLVKATGAGAATQHSVGTGILGGMLAATLVGVFFTPLFYVAHDELVRRQTQTDRGTERGSARRSQAQQQDRGGALMKRLRPSLSTSAPMTVAFLASALLLSACSSTPERSVGAPQADRPLSLPQSWKSPANTQSNLAERPFASLFRDAELEALIQEALRNSPDIRIAAQRVELARAQYGLQKSVFSAQPGRRRQRKPATRAQWAQQHREPGFLQLSPGLGHAGLGD